MGFLSKVGGDLVSGMVDLGGSLIGQKYASDLQGHEIDKQAEYDRNMTLEMFNRNVSESDRVYARAKADEAEAYRRSINREEDVYNRDIRRADEVWEREKAYNLELWNRENEYNSPASQMARFKSAGLNPRLIYDKGNPGNAGSIASSSLSSPSGGSATLGVPSVSPVRSDTPHRGVVDRGRMFLEGIGNYIRLRQVGLATQQLAIQNALAKEQAEHLRIQNESDSHDLGLRKDSGIGRDDNMILKFLKRGWTDMFNSGKRFGSKVGQSYVNWRDRDRFSDDSIMLEDTKWRTLDYDMRYNGVPSSMIPGNGEEIPAPVTVEWNWLGQQ